RAPARDGGLGPVAPAAAGRGAEPANGRPGGLRGTAVQGRLRGRCLGDDVRAYPARRGPGARVVPGHRTAPRAGRARRGPGRGLTRRVRQAYAPGVSATVVRHHVPVPPRVRRGPPPRLTQPFRFFPLL